MKDGEHEKEKTKTLLDEKRAQKRDQKTQKKDNNMGKNVMKGPAVHIFEKQLKKIEKKCHDNKPQKRLAQKMIPEKNDHIHSDNGNDLDEETGTWIQCSISECGKWRYVADISDPVEVPDNWDCSMNSDENCNSCEAPEVDYDESEHIMTKYTLGSIVWAKMNGFPWWPAMIDTDPDYDTYFELPSSTSMIPYIYHVTFLDELVSRAWIKSHMIIPYDHTASPNNTLSKSLKKDLHLAVRNADLALESGLQNRLDKYSFSKCYSKSKTSNVKMSRQRKRKDSTQKNSSVGKEDNKTEPMFPNSNKTLKELEKAIKTCSDSNDGEKDDEDHIDCDNQSSEGDEDMPLGKSAASPGDSELTEKLYDHDCSSPSIGSDSDNSEFKGGNQKTINGRKGKLKLQGKGCSSKNNFDPEIFTMEIDYHEDVTPVENQNCNKFDKKYKSNLDVENDNKEAQIKVSIADKDDETIDVRETPAEISVPLKKDKQKLKRAYSSKDKFKFDHLHSKDSEKKKTKLMKKELSKSESKKEQYMEDMESEKENKDPKHAKIGKHFTSSKKRETKELSGEDVINKPQKHLLSSSGVKKLTKEKDSGTSGIPKFLQKSSTILLKRKEDQEKIESKQIDQSEKEKIKRERSYNKKQKMEKLTLVDNDEQQANLQQLKDKLVLQNNEMKSMKPGQQELSDPIKKQHVNGTNISMKKQGLKLNKFINPVKPKRVSNSSDRDVSSISCKKKKSKICNLPPDQFVPDLSSNIIEDNVELSDNEIHERCHKSRNEHSKDCDEEELNLSIDSLEAGSQHSECLMDLDLKDHNEKHTNFDEEKKKKNYGSFGGHCSDHGSDSDPFELIEE